MACNYDPDLPEFNTGDKDTEFSGDEDYFTAWTLEESGFDFQPTQDIQF